MNPVLILTHNCLELTKKCVDSVLNQDVAVTTFVVDNGSTDGTDKWLSEMLGQVGSMSFTENAGVSRGWNEGLDAFFDSDEHVLVLNNDTQLPTYFYSELLSYGVPFVTGSSCDDITCLNRMPEKHELVPHPDFSAFLIRRECWERIGKFDESMVNYASDLDYHIRAHRQGIHLMNAGVPFYHERSSTLKNSTPKDKRIIELQADADRDQLTEKWGCKAWDQSYAAMFDPATFGVDHPKVKEIQSL